MTNTDDTCDRYDHSIDGLEQTLDGEAIYGRCRDQARGRSASRTADQHGLGKWYCPVTRSE